MSPLLTKSRMQTYRKCARLEKLKYVDGWRVVEDAEALVFGILWHEALEAWWLACMDRNRAGALDLALAAIEGKGADEFAQVKCEELLRGYHAKWADQELDVLGVEDEFRAPLINPDTMAPSRTWTLAGKIDARAHEPATGRNLIVEHKTTSENIDGGADYWAKLHMDHQVSIYTIGAETLGWAPDGCLYDVVKKPTIKPLRATPPESRKYKKDGELYANQRETDEAPEEYRARLREDIEAAPDKYFARREVPRTESQLRDFLADAWDQGRSMRDDHLADRAPRNPDACFAYGRCPFFETCSTGLDPADYPERFRKLDYPHPELTPEPAPLFAAAN